MNENLKSILDHSLDYAIEMIEETSELHPFGAFTDKAGQVHPLEMEIDKKQVPTNGRIIEVLWDYCMKELEEGNISAFGISMESSLKFEGDEEEVDVIVTIPHHKDEQDLPAYCTPFKINDKGSVVAGELFAVDKKFFN